MQPNFQNASTVRVMDTRSATLVAHVLRREGRLIIQPTLQPYNRKMINLFSNNHNNWLSINLLRLRLPSSHNPLGKLTLPDAQFNFRPLLNQHSNNKQRISHGHGLIGLGGGIPSGLSCVAQIFVNAESMDRLPEITALSSRVVHKNFFVIDSGATWSTCNLGEAFTNMVPDAVPIMTANGEVAWTMGRGDVGPFKNVYYTPTFPFSLLSVPQLLAEKEIEEIGFGKTECKVYFTDGSFKKLGDKHDNMYILPFTIVGNGKPVFEYLTTSVSETALIPQTVAMPAQKLSAPQLTHNRFVHISDRYLYIAVESNFITGLLLPSQPSRFAYPHCEACALTKATRIPASRTPGSMHNKARSSPATQRTDIATDSECVIDDLNVDDYLSTPLGDFPTEKMYRSPTEWAILSFISWDLKGPLPTSVGGARYALFGVCRVSRKRFDYYLKKKSEVIHYVINVAIAYIKGLGGCMKVFKSDNGGEFIDTDLLEALEREGITVEHTSPYSPHQNGISERTNRTVFELAFALMYAANTPISLWPYACRTVIHVLDHLPTRGTNMLSTAFIMVNGYIPDVSYFRTFGCDAYAVLPDSQQPANGLRARKGIFIGYDGDSLGYLFYDPKTKRITKTGHISFNEDLSSRQAKSAQEITEFEELHRGLSAEGVVEEAPTAPLADEVSLDRRYHLTPSSPAVTRSPTAPTSYGASVSSPTPLPAHQRPDSDDEDEAEVQEAVPEVPFMVPPTVDVSKHQREQSTRDTGRVVTWEATNKRSISRTANHQPAKQIGSSEISVC